MNINLALVWFKYMDGWKHAKLCKKLGNITHLSHIAVRTRGNTRGGQERDAGDQCASYDGKVAISTAAGPFGNFSSTDGFLFTRSETDVFF